MKRHYTVPNVREVENAKTVGPATDKSRVSRSRLSVNSSPLLSWRAPTPERTPRRRASAAANDP